MTTTVRPLSVSSVVAAALLLALPPRAGPGRHGQRRRPPGRRGEQHAPLPGLLATRKRQRAGPVRGGAKAETVVVLELTQGHPRAAGAHGHRRDRRPRRAPAPGDAGPGLGARAQEHRQGHARVLDARQPDVHAGRTPEPGDASPAAVHDAGRLPDPLRRVPAHRDLGDRGQVALLRHAGREGKLLDPRRARRQGDAQGLDARASGRTRKRSTPPRKSRCRSRCRRPRAKKPRTRTRRSSRAGRFPCFYRRSGSS